MVALWPVRTPAYRVLKWLEVQQERMKARHEERQWSAAVLLRRISLTPFRRQHNVALNSAKFTPRETNASPGNGPAAHVGF
jgi:hypothetical protein